MSEKTTFRLRIKFGSLIFGTLAGVGYLVLMQQYGATTLTAGKLLLAVLLGLVGGIVIPSLATLIPRKKKSAPDVMSASPNPVDSQGGTQ